MLKIKTHIFFSVFVYVKLTSIVLFRICSFEVLVKYASEKSRKVTHPDEGDFTEAWRECLIAIKAMLMSLVLRW